MHIMKQCNDETVNSSPDKGHSIKLIQEVAKLGCELMFFRQKMRVDRKKLRKKLLFYGFQSLINVMLSLACISWAEVMIILLE